MEKPFVVGVDDVLNVYVRHNPEVSGEFPVSPEGQIFMPLVGDVQAADLTKAELQASLTEKLSKFIINPEVAVGVSQYRSKKVYVVGEVMRTGECCDVVVAMGQSPQDVVEDARVESSHVETGQPQ